MACMTGVDEQVGRIVQALKEKGLWENTILVFTSDHGDCMGRHHHIGKNIYYEEAMRIPMMISWPGKIQPRRDSVTAIAFADLYPSLLSMMGFRKVVPAGVETFDLSQRIMTGKGKQPEFQPYYWIDVPRSTTHGQRGLRTGRYTFVVEIENGKVTDTILFDRRNDPYEMKNVAADEPEVVDKLGKALKRWLRRTDDPLGEWK